MGHRKIVAVSIAALALAGCQSKVDGQAVGGQAGTSAVHAPSSVTTSSSSAPPPPANGGDAGITATGTTRTVGQPATVLYETESLSKESTKVTVTAVSVKKGAISDLKNFNLDAQTKVSEPYYVTMSFRNAGPKVLKPGGIFGLINAHNAAGDELGKLSLLGSFKQCDGNVPETLAVGASYTDCGVYVAPPGQGVVDVEFDFYLDLKRTQITWKTG
jgi:hypothetical protein